MSKGIVGKIWNIKAQATGGGGLGSSGGKSGGSGAKSGRSAAAQIHDSVAYITNSEKCDMKLSLTNNTVVGNEVTYVMNDVKTLQGLYVGCRHITDISNATNEMMQIKEFFDKTGGRVALHGIVSLDEEESDKKNAWKLMYLINDLMQEVFPDNQVVYAVHTNTENLHVHFIVNTVGLNGRKIHMDNSFMSKVFEPALNKLAIKYGFTPNENWIKEKKKDPLSIVERKMILRKMIDDAIEVSDDFEKMTQVLRDAGITVNIGKFMSVQTPEMPKRMRTYQLGPTYTLEKIVERIADKKEPFKMKKMGYYVNQPEKIDMLWFEKMKMKKYRDMTKEEKCETISLLKCGRSPWTENYQNNWQVGKIASSLNKQAHIYEIIRLYSDKGNIEEAKEEIIKRQKSIADDKKKITENLRVYKQVTNLYQEMKKYETRAYLYEFCNCTEYRDDYEKYRELTVRLNDNYDKTVDEVADFLEEQNNELLYARAQSKELSDQYKLILAYESESCKIRVDDCDKETSLYEAVGHGEALDKARHYSVLTTREVYIVAENKNVKMHVITTPAIIDGKATVKTTVSVMTAEGIKLKEFSSDEMSVKEFNKNINKSKNEYGFYKCHTYEDEKMADERLEREKNRKVKYK